MAQRAALPGGIEAALARWAAAAGSRLLVIFGSAAAGRARPRSDVDLALAFDAVPEPERRLRMIGELEDLCGRPVDVVFMRDETNPILRFEIFRGGRPLYEAEAGRTPGWKGGAEGPPGPASCAPTSRPPTLSDIAQKTTVEPNRMPAFDPADLRIELPDPALVRVYRRMSTAERLAAAFSATALVRARMEAHLRAIHPDWSTAAVQAEIARRWRHGG